MSVFEIDDARRQEASTPGPPVLLDIDKIVPDRKPDIVVLQHGEVFTHAEGKVMFYYVMTTVFLAPQIGGAGFSNKVNTFLKIRRSSRTPPARARN